MSATTFKVNTDYFTQEKTQEFLFDHEAACQTMEADAFLKLFIKYDLTFIEDYNEVINSILDRMYAWKDDKLDTILLKVKTSKSNCIFCEFGKSVKVYTWKYSQRLTSSSLSRVVYENEIGFRFDLKDGRLIEYGICNAYR
jgi:hypothetical protein